MDQDKIKDMIRGRGWREVNVTPQCPDITVLAAALDGALDPARRGEFEAHVADCDYCIASLSRIARLQAAEVPDRVAETTMARARKLVNRPSTLPQFTRWAAAAVVVLAALLAATEFMPSSLVPESAPLPTPEIRNFDHNAYRPTVLSPNQGATLATRSALFRWSEVPGSLHYNIRVVSSDGAIVWQQRVDETVWRLPTTLRLASNEMYYFRVDAYLSDARSVSSRHVLFEVEDPR